MKTNKMYLTQAEAKEAGLGTVDEQIERHNRRVREERARRNADAMTEWLRKQVEAGR